MKLKFHPEARTDLREGRAFYRRRSPLAALSFAHDIEGALKQIAEAPQRYPEGEHGTREFVLPRRFPFSIVYKVRGDQVTIVAVAHQSREPGYWHHRT
jgi:plasmid stabilization system protein ParE